MDTFDVGLGRLFHRQVHWQGGPSKPWMARGRVLIEGVSTVHYACLLCLRDKGRVEYGAGLYKAKSIVYNHLQTVHKSESECLFKQRYKRRRSKNLSSTSAKSSAEELEADARLEKQLAELKSRGIAYDTIEFGEGRVFRRQEGWRSALPAARCWMLKGHLQQEGEEEKKPLWVCVFCLSKLGSALALGEMGVYNGQSTSAVWDHAVSYHADRGVVKAARKRKPASSCFIRDYDAWQTDIAQGRLLSATAPSEGSAGDASLSTEREETVPSATEEQPSVLDTSPQADSEPLPIEHEPSEPEEQGGLDATQPFEPSDKAVEVSEQDSSVNYVKRSSQSIQSVSLDGTILPEDVSKQSSPPDTASVRTLTVPTTEEEADALFAKRLKALAASGIQADVINVGLEKPFVRQKGWQGRFARPWMARGHVLIEGESVVHWACLLCLRDRGRVRYKEGLFKGPGGSCPIWDHLGSRAHRAETKGAYKQRGPGCATDSAKAKLLSEVAKRGRAPGIPETDAEADELYFSRIQELEFAGIAVDVIDVGLEAPFRRQKDWSGGFARPWMARGLVALQGQKTPFILCLLCLRDRDSVGYGSGLFRGQRTRSIWDHLKGMTHIEETRGLERRAKPRLTNNRTEPIEHEPSEPELQGGLDATQPFEPSDKALEVSEQDSSVQDVERSSQALGGTPVPEDESNQSSPPETASVRTLTVPTTGDEADALFARRMKALAASGIQVDVINVGLDNPFLRQKDWRGRFARPWMARGHIVIGGESVVHWLCLLCLRDQGRVRLSRGLFKGASGKSNSGIWQHLKSWTHKVETDGAPKPARSGPNGTEGEDKQGGPNAEASQAKPASEAPRTLKEADQLFEERMEELAIAGVDIDVLDVGLENPFKRQTNWRGGFARPWMARGHVFEEGENQVYWLCLLCLRDNGSVRPARGLAKGNGSTSTIWYHLRSKAHKAETDGAIKQRQPAPAVVAARSKLLRQVPKPSLMPEKKLRKPAQPPAIPKTEAEADELYEKRIQELELAGIAVDVIDVGLETPLVRQRDWRGGFARPWMARGLVSLQGQNTPYFLCLLCLRDRGSVEYGSGLFRAQSTSSIWNHLKSELHSEEARGLEACINPAALRGSRRLANAPQSTLGDSSEREKSAEKEADTDEGKKSASMQTMVSQSSLQIVKASDVSTPVGGRNPPAMLDVLCGSFGPAESCGPAGLTKPTPRNEERGSNLTSSERETDIMKPNCRDGEDACETFASTHEPTFTKAPGAPRTEAEADLLFKVRLDELAFAGIDVDVLDVGMESPFERQIDWPGGFARPWLARGHILIDGESVLHWVCLLCLRDNGSVQLKKGLYNGSRSDYPPWGHLEGSNHRVETKGVCKQQEPVCATDAAKPKLLGEVAKRWRASGIPETEAEADELYFSRILEMEVTGIAVDVIEVGLEQPFVRQQDWSGGFARPWMARGHVALQGQKAPYFLCLLCLRDQGSVGRGSGLYSGQSTSAIWDHLKGRAHIGETRGLERGAKRKTKVPLPPLGMTPKRVAEEEQIKPHQAKTEALLTPFGMLSDAKTATAADKRVTKHELADLEEPVSWPAKRARLDVGGEADGLLLAESITDSEKIGQVTSEVDRFDVNMSLESEPIFRPSSATSASITTASSMKVCPLCSESVEAGELESHVRSELNYTHLWCLICQRSFVSEAEATGHFRGKFASHPSSSVRIGERRQASKEAQVERLLADAKTL